MRTSESYCSMLNNSLFEKETSKFERDESSFYQLRPSFMQGVANTGTSTSAMLPLLRPPGFMNNVSAENDRRGSRFTTVYPERFGVIENSDSSIQNCMEVSECNLSPAMRVDSGGSRIAPFVHVSRIEPFYSVGVSSEAIWSSSLSLYHSPMSSATVNPFTKEIRKISEPAGPDLLESSCVQSSFDAAKCSVQLVSPKQVLPFESNNLLTVCKGSERKILEEFRRPLTELEIRPSTIGNESQVIKVFEQDHEFHIWTERERRKKMRGMFVTLHSMLPDASAKADKSTIVDEAICYIKLLEQKLKTLLTTKAARPKVSAKIHNSTVFLSSSQSKNEVSDVDLLNSRFPSLIAAEAGAFQTWCSPNVVLNICGADAFINICATSREGLLSKIFSCVLEPQNLEILNVQISSGVNSKRLLMIHLRATDESDSGNRGLKTIVEDLMTFLCIENTPAG